MPKLSQEKKDIKKDYILDMAFELFAEKGYDATSIRDIMGKANVSKGGIYVYFDSKLEILLAIMKRFDLDRKDIYSDLDKNTSADEMLRTYLIKRLSNFKEEKNQKWIKISLMFWTSQKKITKINELNNIRYNFYREDLENIIKKGVKDGIFYLNCNIDSVIYSFMSMIDGIAVMSGVIGKVITDEQINDIVNMQVNNLYKSSN